LGHPDQSEVPEPPDKIAKLRRRTMHEYFVYIMTNDHHTVLYTGVTNNLIRRVYEHKNNLHAGFTKKYNCHKLVWFDTTTDIQTAMNQEKRIKRWKREFKQNLINKFNPDWKDLYDDLLL
jgi:putative endonuclease